MTTPGSHGPGEQPPAGGSGWGQPTGGSPQPGSVPPPAGHPQGQQPGQFPQGQQPGQFPEGQYPQGQYPQGQQPGQFPQGQYPQGQYPPPQGQFPPGQPQGWAPAQQSKSSVGKWLAIGGGIVAVLIVAVVALALLAGGDPEPGDCLSEDNQELAVVDCDDSSAAWRLIGVQEGEQSYDEYLADPETCAAFPTAEQSFWVGENGDQTGQGVVYCVTGV
jgi:hypothetical protein